MKAILSNKKFTLMMVLMLIISVIFVRSGKYTYLVNSIFFLILFIFYRTSFSVHFFRYFFASICFLLWGIARGNEIPYMIEDFINFTPLILLFFHNYDISFDLNKRMPGYLANSLLVMIPISFLIYTYMDYSYGDMVVRFNYDQSTKLALFSPMYPIIFAPYLLFFFNRLNLTQKCLVHAALIWLVVFNILTLTRSHIIGVLIAYILFFIQRVIIQNRSYKSIVYIIILLAIVLVGVSLFGSNNNEFFLNNSIEALEQRNRDAVLNDDITTGRAKEMQEYLNQNLTVLEYLFGRGFGGIKVDDKSYNPFIGGPEMMHFGPVHAFLKGGIALVLILYLPLLVSIFKYWRNPNLSHVAFILLYFLVTNMQTTTWNWSFHVFFYWYALSYLFYPKMRENYIACLDEEAGETTPEIITEDELDTQDNTLS